MPPSYEALEINRSDEDDSRALAALAKRYNLSEADIANHPEVLDAITQFTDDFHQLDEVIRKNPELLTLSVRNSIGNLGYSAEEMSARELDIIVGSTKAKMTSDFVGMTECLESNSMIRLAYANGLKEVNEWLKGLRYKTIPLMSAAYSELFDSWDEAEHELSDEEMEAAFTAKISPDSSFLTTHFDSFDGDFTDNTLLTHSQGQEAVAELSNKFSRLLEAINERNGNKIQRLQPSCVDAETLELKVDGVSRKMVSLIAQQYGVFISPGYKSPTNEDSFRIAFHPFMGNDALKILGRVLERCCDQALVQSIEKKHNELQEYASAEVQNTLDEAYIPIPILKARQEQDRILRERFLGKELAIADIGCGNGYHGEIFAEAATRYDGFEIVPEMAAATRQLWAERGLDKARLIEGDASTVELEPDSYDVVWSLYFTPGNFRDEFEDLSRYDDAYLDKNPAFIGILSNFYTALKPGGKMFLTVYRDRILTKHAQIEFYRDTGQHVVTHPDSRFVATEENLWSVRFTQRSMLSNLSELGISSDQVEFHEVGEIGWLVEITK